MPVVYRIDCDSCGNSLDIIETRLDNDSDLIVIVAACEYCLEQAREEVIDGQSS